jgi:uncharacterized RDD family membrane protein YckC
MPPQVNQWMASMTGQPVAGPAGFVYADVPNRLIAYIIDAIIVGVVNIIVFAVLWAVIGSPTTVSVRSLFEGGDLVSVNYVVVLLDTIVATAIGAGYYIFTWTQLRGTLGMRMLGIQVGNETDGATLTMNQAIYRWLLLGAPFGIAQAFSPAPGLSLLLGLAALIWVIALLVTTAQSPTKQGLHDRYAHTMVVKAARSVV